MIYVFVIDLFVLSGVCSVFIYLFTYTLSDPLLGEPERSTFTSDTSRFFFFFLSQGRYGLP